jgi:hypothetical protein
MRRFSSTCLVAASLISTAPAPVLGQIQTPVLQGVDSVAALVLVTWGAQNSPITGTQYENQLRDAFELGLLRAGLRLEATGVPDGVILCTVVAVGSPTIGYAVSVEFKEPVFDEDTFERRIATTWSYMQAMAGGQQSIDGGEEGTWCAEQFEIEWRKAN